MEDKDPNKKEKAAQGKQKLCRDKKTLKNTSINPLRAKRRYCIHETKKRVLLKNWFIQKTKKKGLDY